MYVYIPLIISCSNLTQNSHPYGDPKRPWNGEFWNCQCANDAATNVRLNLAKICSTSMDAHKEKHHARNSLVTVPTAVCTWIRGSLGGRCGWGLVRPRQHTPTVSVIASLSQMSVSHLTLISMVFWWLFIPWMQRKLDSYQHRINNTRKRRDKKKVSLYFVPP